MSTNPFGLGLFDLILKLMLPILEKDSIFNKIDFYFGNDLNILFEENKVNYFSNIDNIDEHIIKIEHKQDYGTSTKFFFYFFELLNLFYLKIFTHVENLSRHLQKMENEIKKMPNGYQKKMKENILRILRTSYILYKLLVEDPEKIKYINKFYYRYFQKILEQKNDIIIPQYYLLNYIELESFLGNIIDHYYNMFGKKSFKQYLDVLEILLSEKFNKSNINVRSKFLNLLITLNIMENGSIVKEMLFYINSEKRLDNFFKGFLKFYSAVEFIQDHQQIGFEKYRYRFCITKFINTALKHKEYVASFKRNLDTKEATDFLGHMLNDLNHFIEDSFDRFVKIRKMEERKKKSLSKKISEMQIQEEQNNVEDDLPQQKMIVKSNLKYGRTYLVILEKISEITPHYLENEEWCMKIGGLINFYAQRMSSKSYRNYKFDGIKELGLKPLQFIKTLVLFYYRMRNSKKMKDALISDQRSFSKEVLIDIGRTAFKKKLVSNDVLDSFNNLIFELEEMKQEKDMYNNIINECPDEYNCQLTYNFMENPVYLPSSHLTVDIAAIKQHITLNGEYDPYTREKLTIDMVKPLPELKEKIDEWYNEKTKTLREELKNRKKDQGIKDIDNEEEYEHEDSDDDDDLGEIKKL